MEEVEGPFFALRSPEDNQQHGHHGRNHRRVLLPEHPLVRVPLADQHLVHASADRDQRAAHDDHGDQHGEAEAVEERGRGDHEPRADPAGDQPEVLPGDEPPDTRLSALEPAGPPQDGHGPGDQHHGRHRRVEQPFHPGHSLPEEVLGCHPEDDIRHEVDTTQSNDPDHDTTALLFGGSPP